MALVNREHGILNLKKEKKEKKLQNHGNTNHFLFPDSGEKSARKEEACLKEYKVLTRGYTI